MEFSWSPSLPPCLPEAVPFASSGPLIATSSCLHILPLLSWPTHLLFLQLGKRRVTQKHSHINLLFRMPPRHPFQPLWLSIPQCVHPRLVLLRTALSHLLSSPCTLVASPGTPPHPCTVHAKPCCPHIWHWGHVVVHLKSQMSPLIAPESGKTHHPSLNSSSLPGRQCLVNVCWRNGWGVGNCLPCVPFPGTHGHL